MKPTLIRSLTQRIIVSCGPLSYLAAASLKADGIPARMRVGFADYFSGRGHRFSDHWVVEYWKEDEKRWAMADIDGMGDIEKDE